MTLFDKDSYLTRVVLIPSAVFLSAIFGGAYGSGREVVEFMTRYGPIGGLLSIVSIALAFAGCLFVCFEVSRLTGAYDYRAFGRVLLRGASPLYETVLVIGLLLALAINATASGTLIAGHFGYPPASAVGLFLLAVVVLTFFGRRIVEASMILAFAALIAILAVLAWIVAAEHGDAVVASFSATSRGSRRHRRGALGGARHRRTDPAPAILRPRLAHAGRSRRRGDLRGVLRRRPGRCLSPVLHAAVSADHRRRVAGVSADRRRRACPRPQRVRGRVVLADDSDGRRGALGNARGLGHDAARSPLATLVRVGPRRDLGQRSRDCVGADVDRTHRLDRAAQLTPICRVSARVLAAAPDARAVDPLQSPTKTAAALEAQA